MKTFYNVENGLFIVEKVHERIFVYDCGGQGITRAIKRAFPKRSQIVEAVFISHFDSDHINGIHSLLTHCNVKRLILPLLEDSTKIILLSENYTYYERGLIFDTENYIHEVSRDTIITYVSNGNNGDVSDNRDEVFFDNMSDCISSGQIIKIDNTFEWMFIPWYLTLYDKWDVNSLASNIISLYKEKKILEKDFSIKQLWKEYDIQKGRVIKNALINCVGNLTYTNINESSLTVYSGPLKPNRKDEKLGCLYLGDYNALTHFQELLEAYKFVWNLIRIIQIPHHGSIKNYSSDLINNDTIAIISVSISSPSVKLEDIAHKIALKGGIPMFTSSKGDICVDSCKLCVLVGETYYKKQLMRP